MTGFYAEGGASEGLHRRVSRRARAACRPPPAADVERRPLLRLRDGGSVCVDVGVHRRTCFDRLVRGVLSVDTVARLRDRHVEWWHDVAPPRHSRLSGRVRRDRAGRGCWCSATSRRPSAPVPAFVVVGAEDQTVPPEWADRCGLRAAARPRLGGRPRRRARDRPRPPTGRRRNGCGEPTAPRDARRRPSSSGPAAAAARRWCSTRVAGNGHAWPGGQPGRTGADRPSAAFDASDAMWTFFKAQRRPR